MSPGRDRARPDVLQLQNNSTSPGRQARTPCRRHQHPEQPDVPRAPRGERLGKKAAVATAVAYLDQVAGNGESGASGHEQRRCCLGRTRANSSETQILVRAARANCSGLHSRVQWELDRVTEVTPPLRSRNCQRAPTIAALVSCRASRSYSPHDIHGDGVCR